MATRPGLKRHVKRWWPVYLIAAIAASIALSYLVFFTPNSAAELSLDDASTAPPVDSSDLSGNWSPTPESIAGYRVREQLATLPAPSDAVGRTSSVGGTVEIEDDGSAITALSGSTIEVDMTTLQSDESRRDDRIRTSALQTDDFPTATFELTENVEVPEGLRDGDAVPVDAEGELTLHGVTRVVTIPLEIQQSGNAVEILGSLDIAMADYDIDVSAFGGFVSVEDNGTLEFVLSLQR